MPAAYRQSSRYPRRLDGLQKRTGCRLDWVPDKLPAVYDGRQQLAVKAAKNVTEGLPLDRVRVDLQDVALQGQHDDAPAL